MLIVNLDTHRPLVLLPGRDQRTLATGSENIRKYRLSRVIAVESMRQQHVKVHSGQTGGRSMAPAKSIGDEPERMMYRHMPLIRLVVRELSLKKSPEPEISVPVASLRRPERLKQQTRKNGISIGQRLWPCITRDVVSGKYPVLQACRE